MRHDTPNPDAVAPDGQLRGRGLLAVLASAIAVLAVGGLVLTFTTVSASKHHAEAATAPLGSDVSTSFGQLRVNEVQRIDGTTDMDMGMAMPGMDSSGSDSSSDSSGSPDMDMGVNDMVPEGSVGLTAMITLVNDDDKPAHASPDQFRLLREASSGETSIKPTRTTLAAAGNLPAHSSVDAEITFVVPSDGSAVKLSYRDTPKSVDRTVDLGRTNSDPSAAPADPHHHH